MLRILTWNSNTGFDKMPSKDVPAFPSDIQSSLVPCASVSTKRKRSFDDAVVPSIEKHAVMALPVSEFKAQPHSKLADVDQNAVQSPCPDPTAVRSLQQPVIDGMDNVMADADTCAPAAGETKSKHEAQLATMRQIISSQLSLDILIKHRELRLIDQELAKCQIALEQLRRCSEIPFPAMQPPSEQVSSGKGPALKKASERRPARSPAPWGITDGPYARHYAKWLLQDPHFDGGEPEPVMSATLGNTSFSGRSTRGHFTDFAQMVGKTSRSQRALNHASLPNGFAEPKQKPTGPMILKRKSDGKMVKLVCPDCSRHDFGSAQGFINHCRIGHQRNYASHDAAAEGCGQPVDLDESGMVKEPLGESQPQTPITVPSTPLAPSVSGSSVQPLIRSAHLLPKDNAAQPLLRGGFVSKAQRKPRTSKKSSSAVTECARTPHLSAFIQDRGIAVDLQELVADAETKISEDYAIDDDDEDMDSDSPTIPVGGNDRHPQVAGQKKPMKSASKSIMSPSRQEANSFSSLNTIPNDTQEHGLMALLPSPTNESTQAPSLIDDDEEMDPQSPPSSDEIDEADVHFDVRDDEHPEEGHELRGAELQTPGATCTGGAAPVQPTLSTKTSMPRPLSAKEETRVQFIVEHPNRDGQSDKKRRRIGN